MRTGFIATIIASALVAAPTAGRAQQPPAGHNPSMMQMMQPSRHAPAQMSVPDGRQPLDFPPPMRAQFLTNMRDHVETLNAILQALSDGKLDEAAAIAIAHLGLDSPSAAACKPRDANAPPPASGSMEAMMALYMPEPMRGVGLAMHTAASDFARVARQGDAREALAAFSRITPNCVACHASYRLN